MQMKMFVGALCIGLSGVSAGRAAEVVGGDLTLSFSRFEDDLRVAGQSVTLAKTGLSGSAEFGISPAFGFQIDSSIFELSAVDRTESNIGIHGIYRIDAATSAGLFLARDDIGGADLDYLGGEIARDFGRFDGEVYLGRADGDGGSAVIAGLAAGYDLRPGLRIVGSLDHLDEDADNSLTRVGLGLDYTLDSGLRLSGEIGRGSIELAGADSADAFVEIGVSYVFGPQRGATFGRRGLLNRLPGL